MRMANVRVDGAFNSRMAVAAIIAAFSAAACPGPDRLTEPMISAGGEYFAALTDAGVSTSGGNGGSNSLAGGTYSSGGTLNPGDADAGFNWGPANFDRNGGSGVTYQDHYNGDPCFASCHEHGMTIGGTVYQTNAVDPAPNVEIGVWLNGTLFTSYSGANGNFFTNFLSPVDWRSAEIAVRSANGVTRMPANPSASGDCNLCHGSGHRITAP